MDTETVSKALARSKNIPNVWLPSPSSCSRWQYESVPVKPRETYLKIYEKFESRELKRVCINLLMGGVTMLQLPKIRHPKQTSKLCGCRPICKSRRREWKGILQDTSAETFLDRKPVPECFRRCPTKVFPNSPCPLFGRTRRVTMVRRNSHLTPEVVRICQAPVDNSVDTTYLQYAALAKSIGAWGTVHACCAFCQCGCCCPCARTAYEPSDTDRAASVRRDMRLYDARVVRTYQEMRTMYDK